MTADRRHILLVRLDGLGDALACVPALEGLRRALPGATFGAVCSPANEQLFSRAAMRDVHVYRDGDDVAALGAELRATRYTDAVIATEEPVGYVLARKSGARLRAGFWHRFEKTFKSLWQYANLTDAVYRPAAWVDDPEHEVSALYRLAEKAGAQRPIPDDAARLREWLAITREERMTVGRDAFAMQIAAKLCAGGWSSSMIARLAHAALAASPFRRCFFLASEADMELARAVVAQLPRVAIESGSALLLPPASMPAWLGAIASSAALVTPDTGAAHAAGMLGVPVVDLFEPERFNQLVRQWRPWASRASCLVKPHASDGVDAALGGEIGAALTQLAGAARVTS